MRNAKIRVIVIQDTDSPTKFDAIFPNNWISTHKNGALITYPMFAPMRRLERREDTVGGLLDEFLIKERIRLEQHEVNEIYLEGTGSMILDRPNQLVYACRSVRTDEKVLDDFCEQMGYEKVLFTSTDKTDLEIYHTNVMMALGPEFAICCLSSVKNEDEKRMLRDALESSGKHVIDITMDQMADFCGDLSFASWLLCGMNSRQALLTRL